MIRHLCPALSNFNNVKPLVALAEKLKIKTGALVIPCYVLALLLVFTGIASNFLVTVLGFVYPAYCSVKALESSRKDDDTQWLVYWVVFALFSVLEFFSDMLVGWVPFYWFTKVSSILSKN